MQVVNTSTDLIEEIIGLDSEIQHIVSKGWPETWLQVNLPLGSTRALLAIERFNARTPGRVAERLGVSRTTVTGLLDRLESEGMITRAIDPNDRRCFVLRLTDKGAAIVHQLEGARREQLNNALKTLEPSDLHALQTGLTALASAMRSGEQSAAGD